MNPGSGRAIGAAEGLRTARSSTMLAAGGTCAAWPGGCGQPGAATCTRSWAAPGSVRNRHVLHGRVRAGDDGRRRPWPRPSSRSRRTAVRRESRPALARTSTSAHADLDAVKAARGGRMRGARSAATEGPGRSASASSHSRASWATRSSRSSSRGRGHSTVTEHRSRWQVVRRVLAFFDEKLRSG